MNKICLNQTVLKIIAEKKQRRKLVLHIINASYIHSSDFEDKVKFMVYYHSIIYLFICLQSFSYNRMSLKMLWLRA